MAKGELLHAGSSDTPCTSTAMTTWAGDGRSASHRQISNQLGSRHPPSGAARVRRRPWPAAITLPRISVSATRSHDRAGAERCGDRVDATLRWEAALAEGPMAGSPWLRMPRSGQAEPGSEVKTARSMDGDIGTRRDETGFGAVESQRRRRRVPDPRRRVPGAGAVTRRTFSALALPLPSPSPCIRLTAT